MVYHWLIAGLGVVGLLALWLAVQALARRRGDGDCDGPEQTACDHCAPERAAHCGMRLADSDTE